MTALACLFHVKEVPVRDAIIGATVTALACLFHVKEVPVGDAIIQATVTALAGFLSNGAVMLHVLHYLVCFMLIYSSGK